MPDLIYVEEDIADHPRVQRICARFPKAQTVLCEHYKEVFNPRGQNFRLQKQRPSLILAKKQGNVILEAPPTYGIGGNGNYYFSHMLNCPFDCRYCFLQGMYSSANYVVFVNYDYFIDEIVRKTVSHKGGECHFFSGYDCDSLAYDAVTGFVEAFLPVFRALPDALLELRTKSTQIHALLRQEPLPNCVVAFSFTPSEVSALEKGVPSIEKRIDAMKRLQQAGWSLGVRFDPLIYHDGYEDNYKKLFSMVFDWVDTDKLHSVSMGGFRLPEAFFQKMWKLYPDEAFFAGPLALSKDKKMMGYRDELQQKMVDFCEKELLEYINKTQYFSCIT